MTTRSQARVQENPYDREGVTSLELDSAIEMF